MTDIDYNRVASYYTIWTIMFYITLFSNDNYLTNHFYGTVRLKRISKIYRGYVSTTPTEENICSIFIFLNFSV